MNLVLKLIAPLVAGAALALCLCCSSKAGPEGAAAVSVPAVSTVTIAVEGMTCASCSVAVRTALKHLDSVRDARVSVEEKRAVVDYEPAKVTPEKMVEAINKLGYRASLPRTGS
jgi:copper chaperone CopZ